jgi:hypothetical protein
LDPPHGAVLHHTSGNGELLAQALLILLGASLVANGAHLHDELAAGAGGWCGRIPWRTDAAE